MENRDTLYSIEKEFLDVKSRSNTNLNFSYSKKKQIEIRKLESKNVFKRFFSKLDRGSIRNSILSFVGICFGPILLSIPGLFKKMGVIFAILFLTCNFLLAFISYKFYIILIFHYKSTNLIDLFRKIFGNIVAKIGLILIIIYTIVEVSIFFIIGYELFFNILNKFGIFTLNNEGDYMYKLKTRTIYFLCNFFLVTFLFTKKDMSKFTYFNIFFIIVLFYIIILVFIESFMFYPNTNKNIVFLPKKIESDFFEQLSSTLLCFFSHSVIINIWGETQNPTIKRCKAIKNYSLYILITFFIIFGLSGYLSFLEDTPSLIIEREIKGRSIFQDWFMSIGIICYILGNQVILSLYGPYLSKYLLILFNLKGLKESKRKLLISAAFFISILISIFIIDIHGLFGICGAVLSNIIGYIFPIVAYYMTFSDKWNIFYKMLFIIILIYLVSIPILFIFY